MTLLAAGAAAAYARSASIHTETGADEARRGADAAISASREARKANVIQSPPKIFVSHARFEIKNGSIGGNVHIYNNGANEVESIIRSAIHVLITETSFLPAFHPTVDISDPNKIGITSMKAGDIHWWDFKRDKPINAMEAKKIHEGGLHAYLVGMLRYEDTLGGFHDTFFCRKFHPESKRWKRVDDEEYEYQN